MTEQRIKECTAAYGPLLNHQEMNEPLANLLAIPVEKASMALAAARYRTGDTLLPVDVSVVYVGNGKLNAFADQPIPSECIICLHSGSAVALLDACLKMASRMDPATGRALSSGDRVIVFPEKLELLGSASRVSHRVVGEWSDELTGIGSLGLANAEFGVLLFELASWFVAAHEAMHIVLGHAGYVRERRNLEGVVEFSPQREEKLSHDFSQMIEFSADRNAYRGIARRLLLGDIDPAYEETLLSAITVDRPTYLVSTLVTAVTLLLHLFPKRFCSIDHLFGSHPHPYTRMQWMTMELGHEVGEEVDFRGAILTPLAETAATLKSNFVAPDDWWSYAEQDLRIKSDDKLTPKTDILYQEICSLAKQWSNRLLEFGPIFPATGAE
jgi:hypothetical protein